MDDPRLVFFVVREEYQQEISFYDRAKWKVMFDIGARQYYQHVDMAAIFLAHFFPQQDLQLLHSNGRTCCSDVAKKPLIVTDKPAVISCIISSNSSRYSSSCESSSKHDQMSKGVASPEEILAALEEVPELACDDLLRAYTILCDDIGRHRFRSLLGLPDEDELVVEDLTVKQGDTPEDAELVVLRSESRGRRSSTTRVKPMSYPAGKLDEDGELAINTGSSSTSCPDAAAATICHNSSVTFIIKTWTLRMNDDMDPTLPSGGAPSAAAAAGGYEYPRWVMIDVYSVLEDDDPTISCAMTEAASFSSAGHAVTLSFC
uniref:Uncharacterized protein n=1 Tax=Oryza punctata TaxID=4537 RepID=A0A0E0MD15_ORYPU